MDPRQSIPRPSVIGRHYACRVIEAAYGDIYLFRVRRSYERERRTTRRAERPQSFRPFHLTRRGSDELKLAFLERGPSNERCTTTPPTVRAMAMGDIVGSSRCFISYQAT